MQEGVSAADATAQKIQELREKEAHVASVLHQNETRIAMMEDILKQAADVSSSKLLVDRATVTSEDFRESWMSTTLQLNSTIPAPAAAAPRGGASLSSQPMLALLALERLRDQEEDMFHRERDTFVAEILKLHAEIDALRSVVHERLARS